VHWQPENGIGVIDWADAVESGVPLADLVDHLVHLDLCANDAYGVERRTAALRRIVSARSGSTLSRCLARYAVETGIPAASIPALRVLTWLDDLARHEPEERTGSISLFLLHEEIRALSPDLESG
jgi:hypothetical protein